MDLVDLKKMALLGIAGGLLLTAGNHNTVFAGEQGDSGNIDKEANGCHGHDGCHAEDDDSDDDDGEEE